MSLRKLCQRNSSSKKCHAPDLLFTLWIFLWLWSWSKAKNWKKNDPKKATAFPAVGALLLLFPPHSIVWLVFPLNRIEERRLRRKKSWSGGGPRGGWWRRQSWDREWGTSTRGIEVAQKYSVSSGAKAEWFDDSILKSKLNHKINLPVLHYWRNIFAQPLSLASTYVIGNKPEITQSLSWSVGNTKVKFHISKVLPNGSSQQKRS